MGNDGDILGAAHHSATDQTKTELVSDIHADLVGRRDHRAVHNVLLREQQAMPGDQRAAWVLPQSQVHNIHHMPDEDRRPVHPLRRPGVPRSCVVDILRVCAHLVAHHLPDSHRDSATCQTLQRLISAIT